MPDKEDVTVVEAMVDMVVHILHMVVLLDIVLQAVVAVLVTVTKPLVMEEPVVVEVVQELIQME
jgi:hypothetical protein